MGRRRSKVEIDLIGFLDIVSILIVIVLLVISSLAINLGSASDATRMDSDNSLQSSILPTVKIITSGNVPVNSPVSFLMCDSKRIMVFNPQTGKQTASLSPEDKALKQKLLLAITTARAYLAVKPSCFNKYEKIASIIEETGASVGYEPIEESSSTPWSIDQGTP